MNDGKIEGSGTLLRLQAAIIDDRPDVLYLVTGGKVKKGQKVSDARLMADWLIAQGIDPNRIILEEEARDTYENVHYGITRMVRYYGDASVMNDPIIIVSAARHTKRLALTFRNTGWKGDIIRKVSNVETGVGMVLEWALICLHYFDPHGTSWFAKKNRSLRTHTE